MANALKAFLMNTAQTGMGIGPALQQGFQQRAINQRFDAGLAEKKRQYDASLPINEANATSKTIAALAAMRQAATAEGKFAAEIDPEFQNQKTIRQARGRVAGGLSPEGLHGMERVIRGEASPDALPQIGADESNRKVREKTRVAGGEATARAQAEITKRRQMLKDKTLFSESQSVPYDVRLEGQKDLARIRASQAVMGRLQAALSRGATDPNLMADPGYRNELRSIAEETLRSIQEDEAPAPQQTQRPQPGATSGGSPDLSDQAIDSAAATLRQLTGRDPTEDEVIRFLTEGM